MIRFHSTKSATNSSKMKNGSFQLFLMATNSKVI